MKEKNKYEKMKENLRNEKREIRRNKSTYETKQCKFKDLKKNFFLVLYI